MYPDQKDVEELRRKLEDYYGTAMMNGFPMAVMDLSGVEHLSEDEVRELAEELGLEE